MGICKPTTLLIFITVLYIHAPRTHAQSYLLTIDDVLTQQLQYNLTNGNSSEADLFGDQADNNTKIIVYKNTVVQKSNELSQTAMDVITIVWYVATFLALAAFFMLMACSDRRCRDINNSQTNQAAEAQRAPPTPSPSYSEFAPPSYDTVIKMQSAAKTSIFVIPFNASETGTGNNNNKTINESGGNQSTDCSLYTVNELQKMAH
ncbi:uncharacterized protein LOC115633978 [Scaptodrosophila lebanonensis]|uniref:Uncharacterized protein LOC115633978 n=1 Tax=Drosophila lebanonensis TaxID=7225 RepID=A0A6J2UFZ2_DROLE|nr:uncharacterized protein LOC115633978 [Scaptodrosophila lebanonensis]